MTTPSNSDETALNSIQARLPKLTRDFIAEHYPRQVSVVHVDLLTRHGERTPVAHRIPEISPKNWNFCAAGNLLHQDFLRSVGRYTNDAGTSKDTVRQWQNHIFKRDSRSGGTVFGKFSAEAQHQNDSSQPTAATCGFGQITDLGRRSMTALGAHMRALYVDTLGLLPASLQSGGGDDLYLRTTSYTRALESLQHTIGGLYPDPPAGTQTLRIHVRPSERDNMFPDFNCKNMVRQLLRLNTQSLERVADEYKQLYEDMLKIPSLKSFFDTEFNPGKARVAISVLDIVAPMRVHGLPLPEGVDNKLISRLAHMAAVEYLHSGWDMAALTRMQLGRLVYDLAGKIASAVETDRANALFQQPRLGIYSGHDTTMAPLLAAFGYDAAARDHRAPKDLVWPPFGASIRIELLKDTTTPHPIVQPEWESSQVDNTADISKIPFEKRIRPSSVPDSLYRWLPRRTNGRPSAQMNSRATRDYYVRIWYNDRVLRLPTCRDPGAHHSQLGPAVCTLDGFFKQIARFASSDKEARSECQITHPSDEPSRE
ncbi:phosphoglycerate mutase-like protein [Coemansia reversa NRRL 1564]|uniref:Phosphoglycerate mutase-like protein n=1 Tax=Coemansia reversa (strain ATCC 12441 / NRRL 1564) TaxID=763665 RepID=A0A2G5BL51_COERN|nr:phosphoglycerate mutase-like protein [Coemansia reversa NRRL 1564]|eukprot:PIA19497.1 phosphoglycerate mutase-like protein [Coemansia reversa NRRL 1564]